MIIKIFLVFLIILISFYKSIFKYENFKSKQEQEQEQQQQQLIISQKTRESTPKNLDSPTYKSLIDQALKQDNQHSNTQVLENSILPYNMLPLSRKNSNLGIKDYNLNYKNITDRLEEISFDEFKQKLSKMKKNPLLLSNDLFEKVYKTNFVKDRKNLNIIVSIINKSVIKNSDKKFPNDIFYLQNVEYNDIKSLSKKNIKYYDLDIYIHRKKRVYGFVINLNYYIHNDKLHIKNIDLKSLYLENYFIKGYYKLPFQFKYSNARGVQNKYVWDKNKEVIKEYDQCMIKKKNCGYNQLYESKNIANFGKISLGAAGPDISGSR